MKLLAHFNNLINTNNIAQLQKECLQLQGLQSVLETDKVRLIDYQEAINQLINNAAYCEHDNPQLMAQLLKSHPSPNVILGAAWCAFTKKHPKQLALLLQNNKILKFAALGEFAALQFLAKAIQQSQQELGWLQSNTNLILQSLKMSLQNHGGFLENWLNNLIEGKLTNPLNAKQWENFKNALKMLPPKTFTKVFNFDEILNAAQHKVIQNTANELFKKLTQQTKNSNQDDDNIDKNWHADVIWYIQNKDQIADADDILKRKQGILEFLTEHDINLDFYLDNPLSIDPSLKNCSLSTVRAHFINQCIELENDDVLPDMALAAFNNPALFSYQPITISDETSCNKLMTAFNDHIELRPLADLLEIQNYPLLYAAVKHGNQHIHCFTKYYSDLFSMLELEPPFIRNLNITILHLAVIFNPGAIEPLSKLAGFDINTKAGDGCTALHFAAQFNPKAIELLSKLGGFNINARDNLGYTPLHIAARYNPAAFAPLLMIKGIDVNAIASSLSVLTVGQIYHPEHLQLLLDHPNLIIEPSVLATAITKRQNALLLVLLGKNVDVNKKYYLRNTPLHLAAQHNPAAIEPLSKMPGIELNACNYSHQTPLHVAAASTDPYGVAELLKLSGVKINEQDINGLTPLHQACQTNHAAVPLLLKADGIDVNAKTNTGTTALILACQHFPDLIEHMVNCDGIDVNVADANGNSPLHLTINNFKIVERLVKIKGILVNAKNSAGLTPLHLAVHHPLTIPLLASVEGFEPNPKDKNGNTPLHNAVDYPEAIGPLLALKKIDVNAKNNVGLTPLHLAAAKPSVDSFNLSLNILLKVADDIQINVSSLTGVTPLHKAIVTRNKDAMITLLGVNGIDVNAIDANGDTPLHYAAIHFSEAIEWLIKVKGIKLNLLNKHGSQAIAYLDKSQHTNTFVLLSTAMKKEVETFSATNIDEIIKLFANPIFLRVAKEKYTKDFLDLGADDHFGRHLACDAFCAAIIYCNTPTMLTFESWLVGKMKKVIELDIEMFNKFVSQVTTKEVANPFTLTGWQKWVGVVEKSLGDKPNEALQTSLGKIKAYFYPEAVEKKALASNVAEVVAPVASSVAIISSTTPVLSPDEIAAIKKAVADAFEKLSKVQATFERDMIHNLRSLAMPNATTSAHAGLEQNKTRIRARKWCEQVGVTEFPTLFDRHAKYVNGDLQRAPLALSLLNETVLEALKALPVAQMAEISSSLFGESRNIFLADSSEERAFLSAPVKGNEDAGQELLEMK